MLSWTLLATAVVAISASSNYNYYVFTVEWKPTMCLTTNCVSGYLSTAFNIHGLWPSDTSGSYPSNCNGASYSVSSSVTSLLETCWLSDQGSPQSFWEHEWQKHGTCVQPATTADAFFTLVVGLYNRIGVEALLAKVGITPNDTKTYKLSTLASAFPNKVSPSCYQSDGDYYLENLEICFDLSYNQMDCPQQSAQCGDDDSFIFPTSDISS